MSMEPPTLLGLSSTIPNDFLLAMSVTSDKFEQKRWLFTYLCKFHSGLFAMGVKKLWRNSSCFRTCFARVDICTDGRASRLISYGHVLIYT